MKLPSLQHLLTEAATVLRRFPLPLLCAFILCGVGIYVQRLPYAEEAKLDWLFPVLSTAVLGLTLALTVALAAERYRWPRWGRLAASVGVVLVLGGWSVACPAEPDSVWRLRLFVLLVASHLLVAVVPYLPELRREADTAGFWRYNETLFLRILTAGLYSGVLFAGCALALLAIENLFEVKLDRYVYQHLFTVLGTVFNTWFFLAGVPASAFCRPGAGGYLSQGPQGVYSVCAAAAGGAVPRHSVRLYGAYSGTVGAAGGLGICAGAGPFGGRHPGPAPDSPHPQCG